MFGIHWDLVCKFLEREVIITQIKDTSMGWGNYCDAKIENIASEKVPCVIRGADYIYAGYNHSASWRQYAGIDFIEGNMGFRTTLYAN